jgi:hypothetical protein
VAQAEIYQQIVELQVQLTLEVVVAVQTKDLVAPVVQE